MKNRVNIKLRRDLLSPERIHRHKNYSNVLRQFERKKRFDRAVRLFVYSLVVAAIILFLMLGIALIAWIIGRMENEKDRKKNDQTAQFEWVQHPRSNDFC